MDYDNTWAPYCGVAPIPAELMQRWNFDPFLILVFTTVLIILLRFKASIQRPNFAFVACAVSALIFISPLCAMASALFSIRVTHHILLVSVISPLAVFALDRPRTVAPLVAAIFALLHATMFWAWHYPPVYEAALSNDIHYWVMQATLAATAAAVWYTVRASSVPLSLAVLLFTMMQMGLLGALLTFAPEPVFAPHILTTEAWGLSSLEDQQLAGAIMWIAGSGLYLAAALIICFRLFDRHVRAVKC
jgi:putative membrane protein